MRDWCSRSLDDSEPVVACASYPFIAQRLFIFRKMTLFEGLIQNYLVENICFVVYNSAI